MAQSIRQSLLISPAIFMAMLVASGTVMAAETTTSQVTKLATQIPEKKTTPSSNVLTEASAATTVVTVGVKQPTAKSETVKISPSIAAKPIQPVTPLKTQTAVTTDLVAPPQLKPTAPVPVPLPGTVETSADKLQATPASDSASQVSQAPTTAPSPNPTSTPTRAKKPKYKFSYLGIGVNFGSGGDTSALSETSFAAFSKFALSPSFSIRPALLVNKNTTVFLPVTYDFPISGPGHIAPYVGLGLQSSAPFSAAVTKSDLLLTAGVDYPINSHLALTGGVNLGTSNNSGIGGLLGLAYIFNTEPGPESSTTVSPQSSITPTSQSNATPGSDSSAPKSPPSGDRPASDSTTPTDQAPKTPASEEKKPQITENWNAHFQSTYIYQDKPGFSARYSGANSLLSTPENYTYTFSATGFLGVRLWHGGEFYLNPEVSSVIPVSKLLGLGGLSNGENQKGGGVPPSLYLARAFLRQTWDLGGTKQFVESGQNQLAGDVDSRRLVLTLGKISLTDLYGPNRFSGNPRTQFINYSFLTYSALDYGANARGYTFGANLEYFRDDWAFRIGRVAVPTESNGTTLDWDLLSHYSDQIEVEHSHVIGGQPGKVRLLGFHYQAKMAGFQDALNLWRANGQVGVPSIADVRREQDKFGFGISLEQSLGSDVGAFVFGSWNGGGTENYSYMDVERALAAGLTIQGNSWGRPLDTLGFGYAINGIGKPFRQYLEAGGLGTFIGDGRLNYQPESILETYYNLSVAKATTLGFDLQYIINPAYNADRGPAFFAGARLHVEF